jgi:hypothetical protein
MSHFNTVRTKVTDEAILRKVISSIGIAAGKDQILVSSCGTTTEPTIRVPMWVDSELPNCGFEERGGVFYFVSYSGDEKSPDFAGVLKQVVNRYATEEALSAAQGMRDKGAIVHIRVGV